MIPGIATNHTGVCHCYLSFFVWSTISHCPQLPNMPRFMGMKSMVHWIFASRVIRCTAPYTSVNMRNLTLYWLSTYQTPNPFYRDSVKSVCSWPIHRQLLLKNAHSSYSDARLVCLYYFVWSVTAKQQPPDRVFSAAIWPLSMVKMRFTKARPRPLPSCLREESPW